MKIFKINNTYLLSYTIFLFVNILFVIKYTSEYFSIYSSIAIAILYCLSLAIILKFIQSTKIISNTIFKYGYWSLVALFFIFSIVINLYVDKESLTVDRCVAMESGINSITNGEYPYNIVNMGNESSNLPILIIIGMPFYFIFGTVEYLQTFCFLLFSFLIYKNINCYRNRVFTLLLLILSPCYVYEIYTKSDLFSNFIIALAVLVFIWKNFILKSKIKIEYVALIASLLLLTRIPVVFPLLLLLTKKVYFSTFKNKLIFVLTSGLSISIILFIFFIPAGNWDTIVHHNPFKLQSRQPFWINLIFLATTIFLSFRVKSLRQLINWSGIILFLAVTISFSLKIPQLGFLNAYFGSGLDISHFNMAIPFITFSIALYNDLNCETLKLKIEK